MPKDTKRRCLIIASNYWPEPTGSALYSTDLAETLYATGYEVTVLTGLPHYPWWRIPDEHVRHSPGEHFNEGVRIYRVRHSVPSKQNVFGRAWFEFSFWFNARRAARKLARQPFDIVIGVLPTVASGLVARSLAARTGARGAVIFQDLSGLGAIQSGITGGVAIGKLANYLERRASIWADQIAVVSPAMIPAVEKLVKERRKIEVLLNYTIGDFFEIDPVSARKHFGWQSHEFAVVHTGNIGHKQDLVNVARAARLLAAHSDIRIYIVGHGNREPELRNEISGMANIVLLPSVTVQDYPWLLAAADVLLVNERPSQLEMSLPSKLTSYLAAERPVLAAVPELGATAITLNGVAELVPAGNPEALALGIIRLRDDEELRKDLVIRGKDFAEKNLSLEVGRQRYVKWINSFL